MADQFELGRFSESGKPEEQTPFDKQEQQDKLVELRNDETRVVRRLAACRRFAVSVGGSAGNYATFGQNEEVLLRSFAEIVTAHSSADGRYDQLLAQRYHKAGLTNADVQVLHERLQHLEIEEDDDYDEGNN
ncbi:hypothetical protein ccbrp13_69360 [Ktedonobacteria bacterium brp13]|nr:hypothetical protein ccbrp13_69360 [Ktedonobacteria bacterium brp13]